MHFKSDVSLEFIEETHCKSLSSLMEVTVIPCGLMDEILDKLDENVQMSLLTRKHLFVFLVLVFKQIQLALALSLSLSDEQCLRQS